MRTSHSVSRVIFLTTARHAFRVKALRNQIGHRMICVFGFWHKAVSEQMFRKNREKTCMANVSVSGVSDTMSVDMGRFSWCRELDTRVAQLGIGAMERQDLLELFAPGVCKDGDSVFGPTRLACSKQRGAAIARVPTRVDNSKGKLPCSNAMGGSSGRSGTTHISGSRNDRKRAGCSVGVQAEHTADRSEGFKTHACKVRRPQTN